MEWKEEGRGPEQSEAGAVRWSESRPGLLMVECVDAGREGRVEFAAAAEQPGFAAASAVLLPRSAASARQDKINSRAATGTTRTHNAHTTSLPTR